MSRDNVDRYGYRHRKDSAYGMGESMPGDVGDSQGTFHDRAGNDNNVIINGKAQSYENYQRSKSEDSSKKKEHPMSSSADQFSKLDGEVVEVTVKRVSGSGNPIAKYQGIHVHVRNGKPGEQYEVKLNAKSGYFVGDIQITE
ncbi:hypothetical protein NDI76_19270 [Halogeometricum sp. S1BR25-6]|uniref:TRAM domain-containing protein n=1 Tax=Halogeometricum salsisoli TaxID=2950536 RepID=A0ABU2GL09_9EURY|nr:hypothetical protein [Halogeometricum sp. S1BR25-6]MDS0300894.1 hypothetical protein [Halogeometricum sp. S1BR25-6]